MAQPVAQGDAFSGKIYIDAGDGEGREAHTADIVVSAVDAFDTIEGSATISWSNLVGVSASAGSAGVTFTVI
jgi:hypothetical protein